MPPPSSIATLSYTPYLCTSHRPLMFSRWDFWLQMGTVLVLMYGCWYPTFSPVLHLWESRWSYSSLNVVPVGASSKLSSLHRSAPLGLGGGGGLLLASTRRVEGWILPQVENWKRSQPPNIGCSMWVSLTLSFHNVQREKL
jgi:hypothetical protein